jgi:multicomponent Na+:H+ antiporter subunit D
MATLQIILPVVFPALGALLITNKKIIRENLLKPAAAVIVIINLLLLLFVITTSSNEMLHLLKVNEFIDVYLHPDGASTLFSILASVLWIFTSFYAFEYMKHEGRERHFFVFFLITLGVTIGISFSGNLFTLYMFYELLTLSTFPLVIHSGTDEALESGKKYLIYSFMGATLVLLGMILLYSVTKDLSFAAGGIVNLENFEDTTILLYSYLFMFLGFGVKAALVPFHSWLPNAMVAPTPVSSLLHAVAVVKSGIFSLIRLNFFLFGASAVTGMSAQNYVQPLIVITIIMGSFMAIHQDNLKKRLAYSTISQLGYILLGISLFNDMAIVGGFLHLINHAVIKITLFFVAGAIYYQTGIKNVSELRGIGKKMPITMGCFSIAVVSLIGIPPTNGFVSKWFLALGALKAHNSFYAIILLLSAFLTAAYLLPVIIAAFFAGDHQTIEEKCEPPKLMLIPIVLLTFIIIILGLFPNFVINFLNTIVETII